jgi:hypothetical protein
MEEGKFVEEGKRNCEYCGKTTLFLIEKSGHKFCPNCASNSEIVEYIKTRTPVTQEGKGKVCERCKKRKPDVRYRRARDLFLCDYCMKEIIIEERRKEKDKAIV